MSSSIESERRPAPRAGRRSFRAPGRGWLGVPVAVYLLTLLVFPVILIGLYSVGLKTNVVYPPISYSWSDWKGFLPFLHSGPESVYFQRFILSIKITLIVSVSAVVLAYPLAFFLAFVARRHRYTLLMVMLAPFFTSYLLRIYAWTVMLPGHGTVNSLLEWVGLVDTNNPVTFFYHSRFAIGLVLAYSWIPFVALPIFVVLDNLDVRLLEAAQDLGAGRLTSFLRVTLPLSLPGVIAAFVFVLIPTTGEYITPYLVGGPNDLMFGNFIQNAFTGENRWNFGSVLAMWLMIVVLVMIAVSSRYLTADLRGEKQS
ncbi:MAG: spermidine/putrescine transport system permease protein [Gaiellales bacterium]|jgi:spermidine/putrescine transport system permease protein|nr:spermidine/putrescine transport system permease protein [Gaiellales bacterium]